MGYWKSSSCKTPVVRIQQIKDEYIYNIFFSVLPWPCAAVAAAHAGAAGRGSSQRPGPREVSGSHNTLCRGPPYTCAESAGTLPYPAGREEEKDGLVSSRAKGRREYNIKSLSRKKCIEKNTEDYSPACCVFLLSLIFVTAISAVCVCEAVGFLESVCLYRTGYCVLIFLKI